MGNRAVIAIKENGIKKENPPCIYLHWNGGRDSVEGFLETHNKLGMRGAEDASYALARLTQIIANALGGELSCGITTYECADTAQEQQNYDLEEFTNDCLKAMPESYQSTKKGDIK